MNAEERKKIRELRGDRNLRWVKGDRVGEPSFIMEVDDSLSPEEFLAQTGGSVADSICHTDAEVVVEFFNAMPDLLDDLDRVEAENAALKEQYDGLKRDHDSMDADYSRVVGLCEKSDDENYELRKENAALKARVEVLEEVRKAAAELLRISTIKLSSMYQLPAEFRRLRGTLDLANKENQ